MKRILSAGVCFALSVSLMLLSFSSQSASECLARAGRVYAECIGRVTGEIPFPVSEMLLILLLCGAILLFLRALVRAWQRKSPAPVGQFFGGAALFLSLLLLQYAVTWYPLYFAESAHPVSVPDEVTDAALVSLTRQLVLEIGEYKGEEISSPLLAKRARYPEWMEKLNLTGIYIPMTGEAIVRNVDPFTARHEEMHAFGIADEGQANILAYESCIKEGGAAAYSARLWALKYAVRLLGESSPQAEEAISSLSPEARQDFYAIGGGKRAAKNAFSFLGEGITSYGDLVYYLAGQNIRV